MGVDEQVKLSHPRRTRVEVRVAAEGGVMIVTIDITRVGGAIAQMLMLFVLEFIAFGFAKITLDKQSKVWERVIGIIEILLVFTAIFLWCY